MVRLSQYTYEFRHNPNCPSPFEIRTGGGEALIDHLPVGLTRNLVSYGKTLDEAAERAIAAIEKYDRDLKQQMLERGWRIGRERVERRLAGIVCA